MKRICTLIGLAALCATVAVRADEKMKKGEHKEHMAKAAGGGTSLTGCLQKGDEPDEFTITGEDGKTWGLRSSDVKLADHVGHKVTVTGSPVRESKAAAKKEKAEGKKEGTMEKAAQKQEYGDLRVSSLKMVSDTCSQ